MTNRLRIAFATVQLSGVNSGPGTFTKYVFNARRQLKHELVFFSEDVYDDHEAGVVKVNVEPGLSWPGPFGRSKAYHKAIASSHARQPFDLLWFNTAPVIGSHTMTSELRSLAVQMVSDYSNMISRWPLQRINEFGFRASLVRPVLRRAEKYALKRCRYIVANSGFTARTASDCYRVAESRLRVLPKAVDLEMFGSDSASRSPDYPIRILFLKSDYVLGGLADLMMALRDFPHDFRLTVAGPDGPHHERIRKMAVRAGLVDKLDLVGRVDRTKIPDLLHKHTLMCVPSHVEAFGVALLEALAAGVPVVSTNVGGIPEVLAGGKAGWLAKPFDPQDVRRVLISAIEDADEREKKRETGRSHAAAYGVPQLLSRFQALIEELSAEINGVPSKPIEGAELLPTNRDLTE